MILIIHFIFISFFLHIIFFIHAFNDYNIENSGIERMSSWREAKKYSHEIQFSYIARSSDINQKT